MEFLAESIGLLDIDESCRATVGSVPQQNHNTTTEENERQESDSKVSNVEGLDAGAATTASNAINEHKKITYAQKHVISSGINTKSSEGESSFDQDEGEEEEELKYQMYHCYHH